MFCARQRYASWYHLFVGFRSHFTMNGHSEEDCSGA